VFTKSDGSLTYFSSDTAYYINKRERGFDICIYMLGADHHGYIGRLKATAACAGDDPEYNIHVLIGQLVKIMEGGEEVKLSKRAGTIITLEELVEKVGVDAARYTLIRYPVDTPMVIRVRQVAMCLVVSVRWVLAKPCRACLPAPAPSTSPKAHAGITGAWRAPFMPRVSDRVS